MKLGQFFIHRKLATSEEIEKALQVQAESGGQLGDILFAISNIRSIDYYRTLAQHYGMECVDLIKNPIDMDLLTDQDHDIYIEKMCIPIGDHTVATSNLSLETIDFILAHWGQATHIVCTPKFDILWTLQKRFRDNYLNEAINKLMDTNTSYSAKKTFSPVQKILLAILFSCIAYFLY
ncbi:MAG TPA: hypothetical protein VHM20_04810, partial [Gammaproteobacteria bacterium]|nr:hypothetical protein [Gammaproteobacteria bacterium]